MYNYVSCYCEIILQSITPFPLGACKVVHSYLWLVCYYGIQDYDYVFYTVLFRLCHQHEFKTFKIMNWKIARNFEKKDILVRDLKFSFWHLNYI